MIRRSHISRGQRSTALYSDCETYRYRLMRRWGDADALAFVMLNPSTADEKHNDPTIARCESRARALGYGAVDIVNLFAFRATRPQDLKSAADPEGPGNQRVVRRAARAAGCVVAAWGVHGSYSAQNDRVLSWLKDVPLVALGETKDGHPRHPLYVRTDAVLRPWPSARQSTGGTAL